MFIDEKPLFHFEIEVRPRVVGDVPDGTKVDLEYISDGSRIEYLERKGDDADAGGDEGQGKAGGAARPAPRLKLLSGQDWITVGKDGVADFSGRATISVNLGKKRGTITIGAAISGRSDLRDAHEKDKPKPQRNGTAAYQAWLSGLGDDWEIPLLLPVTFEVAENDANGFAELARSIFLAHGKATVSGGRNSPMKKIDLTVYKANP